MADFHRKLLYILVPAYNEQQTVYPLLEKVISVDVSELGLLPRVIVIDDGSTDSTWAQIQKFVVDYPDAPLICQQLTKNQGKGRAIREGLALCDDDNGIVIIQDADLEYDPAQYPELINPIILGVTQVVYGSRWIFPGRLSLSGLAYALGGRLVNLYLKMIYRTNISDITTCYKTMPVALMKSLSLTCNGFEFCSEVTAKLLNRGETILEVPIRYTARTKKEGKKIRWTDFFSAVYTLTRLRLIKK